MAAGGETIGVCTAGDSGEGIGLGKDLNLIGC